MNHSPFDPRTGLARLSPSAGKVCTYVTGKDNGDWNPHNMCNKPARWTGDNGPRCNTHKHK